MPEIEFDPVDTIVAGAVGVPGRRTFFIQASKDGQLLSVLVEKEQVAILVERVAQLLEQMAEQLPEGGVGPALSAGHPSVAGIEGDPVPLFRAVAIGIGFDPTRHMVLIELHERPVSEDDEQEAPAAEAEPEGYLARLYATPAQARVMAEHGSAAVTSGRPPCPLCGNPLDPEGHVCPKLNGHARR